MLQKLAKYALKVFPTLTFRHIGDGLLILTAAAIFGLIWLFAGLFWAFAAAAIISAWIGWDEWRMRKARAVHYRSRGRP